MLIKGTVQCVQCPNEIIRETLAGAIDHFGNEPYYVAPHPKIACLALQNR